MQKKIREETDGTTKKLEMKRKINEADTRKKVIVTFRTLTTIKRKRATWTITHELMVYNHVNMDCTMHESVAVSKGYDMIMSTRMQRYQLMYSSIRLMRFQSAFLILSHPAKDCSTPFWTLFPIDAQRDHPFN